MLNGSFLDTTFQVGFQPNDTATLSIEDVKPTGLGEYILKTHNTNAANMLTVEKTAATGTTSGLMVNDGTRAIAVEEAFEIGVPAIVPQTEAMLLSYSQTHIQVGPTPCLEQMQQHSKSLQMVPLRQLQCSSLSLAVTMKE